MQAQFDNRFDRTLAAMRQEAQRLPQGQRNRMLNYIDKLKGTVRRASQHPAFEVTLDEQTHDQIADRYIAKKAIFDALMKGRRITLKDSREFKVSEMHTQMHCIRRDIEDHHLPWVLCSRWVDVNLAGKRCKEYWLERPADYIVEGRTPEEYES